MTLENIFDEAYPMVIREVCYSEGTITDWYFRGEFEKVGHDGDTYVFKYRCQSCDAPLYLTINRLEELVEYNRREGR